MIITKLSKKKYNKERGPSNMMANTQDRKFNVNDYKKYNNFNFKDVFHIEHSSYYSYQVNNYK
jgi:hypothetical protein